MKSPGSFMAIGYTLDIEAETEASSGYGIKSGSDYPTLVHPPHFVPTSPSGKTYTHSEHRDSAQQQSDTKGLETPPIPIAIPLAIQHRNNGAKLGSIDPFYRN